MFVLCEYKTALNYLREICISVFTVNYPSMNVRLDCHFINSFGLLELLSFQCTASTPRWIEDLFGKRGNFRPTFPTSLSNKCSDKTKFKKLHHCLTIYFFFTNSKTIFFRCWPHNINSHSEQTWCLYGGSIDF